MLHQASLDKLGTWLKPGELVKCIPGRVRGMRLWAKPDFASIAGEVNCVLEGTEVLMVQEVLVAWQDNTEYDPILKSLGFKPKWLDGCRIYNIWVCFLLPTGELGWRCFKTLDSCPVSHLK